MIAKDLFVSYQERMRLISQEASGYWVLINSKSFQSLSINDEERALNMWAVNTYWDYMAHDGVLYERK